MCPPMSIFDTRHKPDPLTDLRAHFAVALPKMLILSPLVLSILK
jgi:hypothetical protein